MIARAMAERSGTPIAEPRKRGLPSEPLACAHRRRSEACAAAAYTAFKVGELEDLSWQAALSEYLKISKGW